MEACSPRKANGLHKSASDDIRRNEDLNAYAAKTAEHNTPTVSQTATLPSMDTHVPVVDSQPTATPQSRKISEAGLHVETGAASSPIASVAPLNEVHIIPEELVRQPEPLLSQWPAVSSRRSFETTMSADSPASSASSPALGALRDITPLPSPIFPSEGYGAWNKSIGRPHASSSASIARDEAAGILPIVHFSPPSSKKKKAYKNITSSPLELNQTNGQENVESFAHNRSLSEYVPEHLHNVRPRNVTAPGFAAGLEAPLVAEHHMHREEYLARQRGLSGSNQDPSRTLPSPPPSNRSMTDSEDGDERRKEIVNRSECMAIRTGKERRLRYWRPLRRLGEGSFSRVVLAIRDSPGNVEPIQEASVDLAQLVAIKIVSHGPAGGADEERMETSIKREIDVLQSIKHPSLPHMKGFEDDNSRAFLVLNYCAGGDLFEAASQHKDLVNPRVIQRLFAELVGAVRYLHSQSIVHRDIKLENVLLNIPITQIASIPNLPSHSHPLLTLTDLGLSKRLPPPPASPLLHHQCGSIDYTAPEILLGQPYDGRATDAWALGVLLYALMEARLPFDPLPGKRQTSVKHRIARCDWLWCKLGNEDGEWVEGQPKGLGLEGAREIVEGLLKKVGRGRWSLAMVAEHEWVKTGLQVELKTDDSPEDVL